MDRKVFVVIVTYNAVPWLGRCLSSLWQSSIPLEVVVVDNQSTDDTVRLIEADYPQVKLIKSERNLGFGKANNIGMSYALKKGADYVFLLNQDAWVRPDTIARLVDVNTRHPEYYILSPMHLAGDEQRLDLNFSDYAGPARCRQLFSDVVVNPDNLKEVYETSFVNAAFWLMSKNCLQTVGGFDPIFPHYGEDDDIINRVHYHGFKVGICPRVFGTHDRSQVPFDLKNLSKPQKLNRRKVGFLIPLKNINKSFSKRVLSAYKELMRDVAKEIFRLNVEDAWMNIKLIGFITANLSTIKKHRHISKQANANAVWL